MSRWIRQIHRWLSIAFTAGVLNYTIAMRGGEPPIWMGLAALFPLILLLLTGLYMFFLPYATKWRRQRAG